MLRRLRSPILDLLRHFEGKDEWTLKVSHDEASHAAWLQATDTALIALQDEARRLPDGRAYFVRKKMQRATADLVSARLAAVEREVIEDLTRAGFQIGRADREGSGVPVLVERARFAVLEAILAERESAAIDSHITFELVGPWPPYSFTSAMELA